MPREKIFKVPEFVLYDNGKDISPQIHSEGRVSLRPAGYLQRPLKITRYTYLCSHSFFFLLGHDSLLNLLGNNWFEIMGILMPKSHNGLFLNCQYTTR